MGELVKACAVKKLKGKHFDEAFDWFTDLLS